MKDGLLHLIATRSARDIAVDVLDILIVAWVIYRALLILRGTRAVQMGTGLGIIFVLYVVSKWVGFVTLFNLLSTLLSSIILVVVVIFQNDIRRVLMRVGASAVFGGAAKQQESKVIEEVVSAATELARHRIGALICFEQDANLDEFVAGAGTPIDANVQRDLLVSLFIPEGVNRLHDGAVIIRNLRIAAAGAFFPIPDARGIDRSLGTRHRAALGISEETDAVVVVVSEERGTISVCFNGNLLPNLDGASLRRALSGLFGEEAKKKASMRTTKPSMSGLPRLNASGEPASAAIPAGQGHGATDAAPAGSPSRRLPASTPIVAPAAASASTPAGAAARAGAGGRAGATAAVGASPSFAAPHDLTAEVGDGERASTAPPLKAIADPVTRPMQATVVERPLGPKERS